MSTTATYPPAVQALAEAIHNYQCPECRAFESHVKVFAPHALSIMSMAPPRRRAELHMMLCDRAVRSEVCGEGHCCPAPIEHAERIYNEVFPVEIA